MQCTDHGDVQGKSRGEWYFVHTLAVWAVVTLAFLFAIDAYLSLAAVKVLPLPKFLRVVLGLGIFASLWLWIRMLVDFFRERPMRFPVLWGWALVLGSIVGTLPYFWIIWRPRNRPT